MELSSAAETLLETKILVDGIMINYVKVGVGEHPILLLPATLASIWINFHPQIEKLDRKNFTIIAWDPPGYGKSRPPDRTFPKDFYSRDAIWAYKFMKALNYERYSLLGYCGGGRTALILAAKYPEVVRKLIVAVTSSYITPADMSAYEKIRDTRSWNEQIAKPYIALYGEEYFRKTWNDWVDATKRIFEFDDGDICKSYVDKIQCPTLIVHGEKDPVVSREHSDYLHRNIKNSRLAIFEDGSHYLILRHAEKFNALAQEFLSEE